MKEFFKSKKAMFINAILIFTLGNVSGVTASTSLKEITAYLDDGIHIVVNGIPFFAKDSDGKVLTPINYEGNTYLPMRSVAEATGLSVKWDDTTRTAKIGTMDDVGSDDFVISPKDKSFQVTFPSTWIRNDNFIQKINPLSKVGAINNSTDPGQFFGVSSESKSGFSDSYNVNDYSKLVIGQLKDSGVFENFKIISQTELNINGHPAIEYEVTGVVKGNINAVYLKTFVETKTKFYQMTFWSAAKSIDDSKADLTRIASTFKELSK